MPVVQYWCIPKRPAVHAQSRLMVYIRLNSLNAEMYNNTRGVRSTEWILPQKASLEKQIVTCVGKNPVSSLSSQLR